MTISYAITACNEVKELEKLLDLLNGLIRPEDEIVLQLDSTASLAVKFVAEKYNTGTKYEYHRIIHSLNKNFSEFKNNLKDHCSRDYIFFLDADEFLTEYMVKVLPKILKINSSLDLILVPRINTVLGITEDDIKKYRWTIDSLGYINYPDYQTRICRNSKDIRWEGVVHERLVGAKITSYLPSHMYEYALIHPKTIERQRKQNEFYEKNLNSL